MESMLPYLLNTVLGAGGGYLGNMLKKNGLSMAGNSCLTCFGETKKGDSG